jgi:negative regulator of sigma E activity
MTEERQSERTSERQIERDSQLSAMFDGELPAGECELLARRLVRDDLLRAQWSRYSMIGAALRAERGVALHDRVALRVQTTVAKEATYGQGMDQGIDDGTEATHAVAAASATRAPGSQPRRFGYRRIGYPIVGASIAASVAAVSIFWLRGAQDQTLDSLQASTTSPATIVLTPEPAAAPVAVNNSPLQPASNGEPGSYTTPAPGSTNPSLAPSARLANYVVAHSEYSGPLTRRMALLGIVGAEAGEGAAPEAAPAEDVDAP